MEVQELNDIANDVMVARLTIKQLEEEREKILQSIPRLQEIEESIKYTNFEKSKLQEDLIQKMRSSQLKSWKTEQASFARVCKKTVSIDPLYKKDVESKLKAGEIIPGFDLRETEYISIKTV